MITRRLTRFITALGLVLAAVVATDAYAQGVTTGGVTGYVTDNAGNPLENVTISITNQKTGYVQRTTSREGGRYTLPGLEVGGPYTLELRRIGMQPASKTDVMVTLSQATRIDVQMVPQAVELSEIVTTAAGGQAVFSPTRQGIGTIVGDSMLRRSPTLQRDYTDLVKLTPQVVTNTGGGPSAAGTYNRLNNYTVDGANQNDRFNLGSSGGQPGGATGGRIMSIEAVKEFQVLLSPTDVRYGNFAGMLVNAVTKNGTNELHGGATYTFRTPGMAADVDQIRQSGFDVRQYGFSLGGPIIKNKLHFFIAPEWQRRTDPASGPSAEESEGTIGTSTTKVSLDSINRIASILAPRFDVGSAGAFPRENPLTNLMGRLDWAVNDNNRAVFRVLDNTAEQTEFSRNTNGLAGNVTQQSSGIRLTSNSFVRQAKNRSLAGQLFTNLQNGISNEFLIGYNTIRDFRIVPVEAPEISVGVTPIGGTTPSVAVTVGSERFSPGNDLKQKIFELSDNVMMPFGRHTFTVGGRYEHTYIYNFFLSGAAYGAYTFPNIAALQAGTPSAYAFSYANGGDIAAEFSGQQFSLYGQDAISVTPNFSFTLGLRVDVPSFLDTPKQNDLITAKASDIRTDWKPKTQALFSPRLGFNWDVSGRQSTQVRGAIGIFTGQTPYILIGNAYANTGLGGVTVGCTGAGVPAFTTDINNLPKSCANQNPPAPGAAGTVGINLTDPDFKYPQNFTSSLGFDQRLPFGFIGTFEALYRKEINGLYVRDLNLIGPRMVNGAPYTDRNGRILYADTISATGSVTNSGQKRITSVGSPSVNFTEGAIFLTNAKAGHSYSLTGQLRKRIGSLFEGSASYTYMQAKDVQSLTSDRAISNWRNGRQFSGLENDPDNATTSNFQRPHRVMMSGTVTSPWKRYQTDVSFYFEAVSGISLTYVTNNDINGDGIGGNDPIYIPNDATDANEIRIGTGANAAFALNAESAAAFDRFIEKQSCLNEHRGEIMERNSCQAPMVKQTSVSLRQTLPELRGQRLTVQLDIFNFLNLLNKKWGQNEFPIVSGFNNQAVLRTAGHTSGPLSAAQFNYNLDTGILNGIKDNDSPWSLNPNTPSNNYQMQLSFRLAF
jgi:outer membrane receptor for ferrienterochelin and colicin